MTKRYFIQLLCLIMMVSVFSAYAEQKTATAATAFPVAVAKQPRYEFQPVLEGTVVTHEFIIENRGKAALNIEKVRTSCGCTTADYSKVITPGAEGKITIKGNTRGYGGHTFSKTITVYTNDPKNEQIKLYISGEVEAFVIIEPNRVFLSGTTEDEIQTKVTITPVEKYPFHIKDSSADQGLGRKVAFTLANEEDKYVLTITNQLKEPGRYRGRIVLKTDSSISPEIFIYVTGMIREKKI